MIIGDLANRASNHDELHIVFDTYIIDSLTTRTRQKRRGKTTPRDFKVNDETSLEGVTLQQFLAHENTKKSLTVYNGVSGVGNFLVSANGETRGNLQNDSFNGHKEADTLIIHHIIKMSTK